MRNENIDIVKGLGILLVIVGHCGFLMDWNSIGMKLIFSFHMPLFFMVCGFCLSYPMKPFDVKSQFSHLIKPYIIYSLIRILVIYAKELLRGNVIDYGYVVSALFAAGSPKVFWGLQIDWNSPLWFLPCLFFSRWIFQTVIGRISINKAGVVFCVIALGGYCIGKIVWLPFSLCPAMVATVFIYIGYFCKVNGYLDKLVQSPLSVFTAMVSLMLSCFLPTFSLESLSMRAGVVHFLPAIGGVLLMYWLSININSQRIRSVLSWCGLFSINILFVHVIEQVVSPFDILSLKTQNLLGINWLYFIFNVVFVLLRVTITVALALMEVKLAKLIYKR